MKQFKNYNIKKSDETKREITLDCLRILTSIIAFFPNVAGKVNSFIACYHFRVSWYEQINSLLTTCCDSIHHEVLSEACNDTEFYSVEGGPLHGSHGRTERNTVYKPFARWRLFTSKTRIHFVFSLVFKFGKPNEV